MKVICIGSLKGGVAKSNTVFNISGILSEDHRVLLIDADPQSNLSYDCGIVIEDDNIFSIRDIFEMKRKIRPEDVIVKAPVEELPNLDIIPSSIMLFETEVSLITRADKERILLRFLEDNRDYFNQYDYIFLDTNPSMSTININAFLAADDIIIPCDVSTNAYRGAELFCYLWDKKREELRKKDNVSAIVITNYSGGSTLAKDMLAFTHNSEFSTDIVMNHYISTTVRLKETEANHKPVNVLYPNHKSCKQFRDLIQELKEKEVL